jgi:hypothetical protein
VAILLIIRLEELGCEIHILRLCIWCLNFFNQFSWFDNFLVFRLIRFDIIIIESVIKIDYFVSWLKYGLWLLFNFYSILILFLFTIKNLLDLRDEIVNGLTAISLANIKFILNRINLILKCLYLFAMLMVHLLYLQFISSALVVLVFCQLFVFCLQLTKLGGQNLHLVVRSMRIRSELRYWSLDNIRIGIDVMNNALRLLTL